VTKTEHASYWQQQALGDWETVDVLCEGKKYLQSLFWLHLTIEKLCEAVWIMSNEDDILHRTHNLNRLLIEASLSLPDEYAILLTELNQFQLEGRYPNYLYNLYKIITGELTADYIQRVKPLRLWLLSQLPSD